MRSLIIAPTSPAVTTAADPSARPICQCRQSARHARQSRCGKADEAKTLVEMRTERARVHATLPMFCA
jgi:hypothetical protein